MSADNDLNSLRIKIREVDEKLLGLVAERMSLARQVGETKLASNLPVKDYRVEKEVIASSRARAKELGFYEALAEDLMKTLIKYSCSLQDEHLGRSKRRVQGSQKKVLIVGGLGPMGQWLAQYFDSFGHNVSLYDVKENKSAVPDFPVLKNLAEAVQTAEIIVLATPISATSGILDAIVKTGTRALVFDICSLKSPILAAVGRAAAAGLRVTSVHPMFGPHVEMLSGRNIILCEGGNPDAVEEAEALFRESTARLVRMPLERHDEWIAYILGLSHLTNLSFAHTLAESGLPYRELMALGSSTFIAQAAVTEAVVRENQDLYYEIQAENRFTPALLKLMEKTLKDYAQAIEGEAREKGKTDFKSLMQKSREYFERGEESPHRVHE